MTVLEASLCQHRLKSHSKYTNVLQTEGDFITIYSVNYDQQKIQMTVVSIP